jgi:cell division protease FtsH
MILKVHTKKIPLADDVELSVIARGCPGFAGADLANLVNEAALIAARQNRKVVAMADFEVAKDKVMMGVERRSMFITEEEKRHTAYHEAGHALVGALLPNSDPVHKVSIIPRGMALGVTMYLPTQDRNDISKDQCEAQIATAMAGRVADEIFLGLKTAGAANDIERATDLARRMVCEWGMSKLGPLSFGKKDEQIFLGREISQHRDYSESTAVSIDQEVRSIVEEGYNTAKNLIDAHRDAVVRIAEALLEREILDGNEVKLLIAGEPLPAIRSNSSQDKPSSTDGQTQQVLRPDSAIRPATGGLTPDSSPA